MVKALCSPERPPSPRFTKAGPRPLRCSVIFTGEELPGNWFQAELTVAQPAWALEELEAVEAPAFVSVVFEDGQIPKDGGQWEGPGRCWGTGRGTRTNAAPQPGDEVQALGTGCCTASNNRQSKESTKLAQTKPVSLRSDF